MGLFLRSTAEAGKEGTKTQAKWLTSRRPGSPFVKARNVENTHFIKLHNTRQAKHHCMPKGRGVMIVNNQDTVDRPSLCFTRRLKPQRRLYFVWNAPSASTGSRCPSSDASTSNWVVTRSARDK